MATLPRPLLALLVVVIAIFGAWMTLMRPSDSGSAPSAPQVAHAYQAAVASGPAKSATASRAKGSAAQPGPGHTPRHTDQDSAAVAHRSVAASATAKTPAKAHKATRHAAFTQPATPVARAQALVAALAAHKVIALLFYNPQGADDRADVHALQAVSADGGRVVRLAVPISEISRYSAVTQNVPVTGSPTFIVVDARHRAQTLVGFADQLEIDQLVDTALSSR